eukprot:IDg22694t1
MEQRGDQAVLDGYLLLDPKAQPGAEPSAVARRPFREALLFVVCSVNHVDLLGCGTARCDVAYPAGFTPHKVLQSESARSRAMRQLLFAVRYPLASRRQRIQYSQYHTLPGV